VVVDDDVDAVARRQRVVAGLGLGVDEGDDRELAQVEVVDGLVLEAEHRDHGPVLGAADDAAARDDAGHVGLGLGEQAQRLGGGHRVRVGVVVREDEPGAAPSDPRERRVEIERWRNHGLPRA
jgi:hypothetical protein